MVMEIEWATWRNWKEDLERREVVQFKKVRQYAIKGVRQSRFRQSLEFVCHRYGQKKSVLNHPLGKDGKPLPLKHDEHGRLLRIQHDEDGNEIALDLDKDGKLMPLRPQRTRRRTIKCGCTSTLKFKQLQKDPTKGVVFYRHKHQGHLTSHISGIKGQRKSKAFLKAIRRLVRMEIKPELIMERLSISESQMKARIEAGLGASRDDFVTKEDVYWLMAEHNKKKTQRNIDDMVSMASVAEEMKKEGYIVFQRSYESQVHNPKMSTDNCGTPLFAFGFMHPWQIEHYKTYGDSIGLDSTHNTTR
jgi:hypothetical protein